MAEDFDNVYKYIQGKLFQANIKKDPELLEEALVQIRDMRDIWKQIMVKGRTK